MDEPFARLRARFLFLWGAVAAVLAVTIVQAVWPGSLDGSGDASPWPNAVVVSAGSALLFALTALQARRAGLRVAHVYGRFPSGIEPLRLSVLALPLIGVAFIGVYVVFAPLSMVFPEATQAWLFANLPAFYSAGPPYPAAANLIGIASMTVVGPFAEEWFFRGLLLRRWSHKWGVAPGVIGSSLVFGLLHQEILGGFVFGVAMCALAARYRSLWAPTIVHVANNAIVACLTIADAHGLLGSGQMSSVAELRAAWWLPVTGLVLAVPGIVYVWRRWIPIASWPVDRPSDTLAEV
jgi:membrane protease YdiL (CAAX protease family)